MKKNTTRLLSIIMLLIFFFNTILVSYADYIDPNTGEYIVTDTTTGIPITHSSQYSLQSSGTSQYLLITIYKTDGSSRAYDLLIKANVPGIFNATDDSDPFDWKRDNFQMRSAGTLFNEVKDAIEELSNSSSDQATERAATTFLNAAEYDKPIPSNIEQIETRIHYKAWFNLARKSDGAPKTINLDGDSPNLDAVIDDNNYPIFWGAARGDKIGALLAGEESIVPVIKKEYYKVNYRFLEKKSNKLLAPTMSSNNGWYLKKYDKGADPEERRFNPDLSYSEPDKIYKFVGASETPYSGFIVSKDYQIDYYFEEVSGQITASLKTSSSTAVITEGDAANSSYPIDIVLDARESKATNPYKITDYHFWLDGYDLGSTGTVAKTSQTVNLNLSGYSVGKHSIPYTAKVQVESEGLKNAGLPYQATAEVNGFIKVVVNAKPPEPEAGEILFNPPNSSLGRGEWINDPRVIVYYDPSMDPSMRKKPYPDEFFPSQNVNVRYGYPWNEFLSATLNPGSRRIETPGREYVDPEPYVPGYTDEDGVYHDPIPYKPGYWDPSEYTWIDDPSSDSFTPNYSYGIHKIYEALSTFTGNWSLNDILVSGTGFAGDITSGDIINLREGKGLYLSAVNKDWEMLSKWITGPVATKSPSSSDGYGDDSTTYNRRDGSYYATYNDKDLSSVASWVDSISSDSYFISAYPKPPMPSFTGTASVYNIDLTEPSVSINITDGKQPNIWYKGTLSSRGTANDNDSPGVSGLYGGKLSSNSYEVPFSNAFESTDACEANLILTETGIYNIAARVEDYATNKAEASIGTYYLDNTPPEMPTLEPMSFGWTNLDIRPIMNFTDNHSGFGTINYIIDNISKYYGSNDIGGNITYRSGPVPINEAELNRTKRIEPLINKNGIYNLNITNVEDSVGNSITVPFIGQYKFDNTHPSMKIKFSDTVLNVNRTPKRIEYQCDYTNLVTLEVFDNLSGITNIEYAVLPTNSMPTASEWIPVSSGLLPTPEDDRTVVSIPINLQAGCTTWESLKSGNLYLSVRLTDRAGNVLTVGGNGGAVKEPYELSGTTVVDLSEIKEGSISETYNSVTVFINKAGDDSTPDTTEFKITRILDPTWKNTFELNPGYKIYTSEMGAYQNKALGKIKLGYKVNFALDTLGYGYDENDKITINASYFVRDPFNGVYNRVYAYIPEDKYSSKYDKVPVSDKINQIIMKMNSSANALRNGTLNKVIFTDGNDFVSIPGGKEKGTWNFSYYIRPDVKFSSNTAFNKLDIAIKEQASQFINTDNVPELVVVFDIIAEKYYGKQLKYTQKEDKWPSAASSNVASYGQRKSTNTIDLGLINLGLNHGEVFWYDIKNTLLEDIEKGKEWDGR